MPLFVVAEGIILEMIVLSAWLAVSAPIERQMLLIRIIAGLMAASAAGTAITAQSFWPLVLVMIPVGFAVFVNTILGRPTTPSKPSKPNRVRRPATRRRDQRRLRPEQVLLAAAVLAVQLLLSVQLSTGVTGIELLRLTATIALVLAGVSIWISQRGYDPQVIGLLILDDGISLVCELLVGRLALTTVIVLVVAGYVIVPLIYFLVVLPQLRQQGVGLQTDHTSNLKG